MNIFRRTIPFLTAALLLAACDKDADRTTEGGEPSSGGGKVEMTFGFSAADLKTPLSASPVVKAVDDQLVDNLWVLQFDGQAESSTLELCEYYPKELIAAGNKVSVALYESSDAVRIYFIANVGRYEFASLAKGSTLGSFENRMLSFADEAAVTASGNCLPMAGTYDGTVAFQEENVTLTRMVAKIDFSCSVSISAPGESFTINRIQLLSVATGTRYKAHTTPSAQTGLFPDAASSDNFMDYAEVPASGLTVNHTWFLPENLRGVVEGLTASTKGGDKVPAHSTCIEVSGDYTKGDAVYDVTYRIYPGQNSSTDFNMIRNHSYTITSTIKGFNQSDVRVVVEKGIPAGKYLDGVWTE